MYYTSFNWVFKTTKSHINCFKSNELQNFIQSGIESAFEILESEYCCDVIEHTTYYG